MSYIIPAGRQRTELVVINSRFITTIGLAATSEEARAFIASVRAAMPDASHHVYAFRAGYGNSVIEGMSDDGEPSGTAGSPVLAVLRGTDIGDTVIVVTRYFGGTKLGTGGLVRAYSSAAREALDKLQTQVKTHYRLLGIESPYPLYESIKRLIAEHSGTIDDENFAAEVTLYVRIPVDKVERFTEALTELSAGRIQPVVLDNLIE